MHVDEKFCQRSARRCREKDEKKESSSYALGDGNAEGEQEAQVDEQMRRIGVQQHMQEEREKTLPVVESVGNEGEMVEENLPYDRVAVGEHAVADEDKRAESPYDEHGGVRLSCAVRGGRCLSHAAAGGAGRRLTNPSAKD